VSLDLQAWMVEQLRRVEAALSTWVPADAPAGLGLAMRYGVLDGGKRLEVRGMLGPFHRDQFWERVE